MKSNQRALVWFRNDLRITDNRALSAACSDCEEVFAVTATTPEQWDEHHIGDNKRWFIIESIKSLREDLAGINIPSVNLACTDFHDSAVRILEICLKLKVDRLYFNEELELNERSRDQELVKICEKEGITCHLFNDSCLLRPGKVLTKEGAFFKVYTPFKRALMSQITESDYQPTARLDQPKQNLLNDKLAQTCDEPLPIVERTCQYSWQAGETAAQEMLGSFINNHIAGYDTNRDVPSLAATSRLSPYLALGVISIRQCFASATAIQLSSAAHQEGATTWINELIWREFYKHILIGFPQVCKGHNFNPQYNQVPWRKDGEAFQAWCNGKTGYPIVDAAMRQLVQEGWMHNRLRMVTAMFLTKHLLIDWRCGELFFLEHLIDADFAANNGGWQWSASTGADAAPYFRIFNPVRQSQRFDDKGLFIKSQLGELRDLSAKTVHMPSPLEAAAVDYPTPIVEHAFAVDRAKCTFKTAQEHSSTKHREHA